MTIIDHSFRPTQENGALTSSLLLAGAFSSILYVGMNIWAAAQWPGYSSTAQTISELSAVGAPTRRLWLVPGMLYSALIAAFGFGLRRGASGTPNLRLAGTLIVCFGALGLLWPLAPMHQREVLATVGGSVTDAMHLTLGALSVLLMLGAVGLAASTFDGWIRAYSTGSLIVILGAGVLTAMGAPALRQNLPTPMLGVIERISIGAFLLWVIVIGFALLRRRV